MRGVCQREEVAAADVEVEVDGEKGCWLAEARDKLSSGREHEEDGQGKGKEVAPTGVAAGNSGGLGSIDGEHWVMLAPFFESRERTQESSDCCTYIFQICCSNISPLSTSVLVVN